MTIGELSILLGFKIDGIQDADKAQERVDQMASSATKLAFGVDIATTGLALMIHTALDAAVGMQRFQLVTGLSAQELQQWQYKAAIANVSAAEMAQTIEGINKARAKVATTGEGAGIWRLLGIDPSQDPFQILKKLQQELHGVDKSRVALAQSLLSQIVPDSVFAMLRRPDLGPLSQRYIVSPEDQKRLEQLNVDWQNFQFLTTQTKNKFSSELSPEIDKFVVLLSKGVDLVSRLVDWLARRPNASNLLSDAIIDVGLFGAALTGLLGVMKAFTVVADVAFAPEIAALAALAAGAWGAYNAYKALKELTAPIPDHVGLAPGRFPNSLDRNRANENAGRTDLRTAFDVAPVLPGGLALGEVLSDLRHFFSRSASLVGQGFTNDHILQQNTFHINEAGNARATAREVGGTIGGQLAGAGASAQPNGY